MKHYNIEEFVWFVPRPKNKCAINFPRERAFNLTLRFSRSSGSRSTLHFIRQSLYFACESQMATAA